MASGKVIEELVVQIKTDQEKLRKELNTLKGKMEFEGRKVGSKFGKGFSKGFAAVGGVIGVILAVKKAWNFSKVAKDFARDANEIQSKHDTVFRGMEKEANKWAEEFGSSVGRATSEIKKYTSGLGDVLKPLGLTTEEALKTSKQMTQLALDVASFNNRQDADVIHSFTSALTGERESLKTLGIVISEADVKQEAYNSGLVRQGAELTKVAKAQATVNLLFKNSGDAQGDLARTSESLANIEKTREAQYRNMMEVLGQQTIPVFTIFNKLISELYTDMRNNESVLDVFSVTIKGIGTGLLAAAYSAKTLINILKGGWNIIGNLFSPLGNKSTASDAFSNMMQDIAMDWGKTLESMIEMWKQFEQSTTGSSTTPTSATGGGSISSRRKGSKGYSGDRSGVLDYFHRQKFQDMVNSAERSRGSAGYDSSKPLTYEATQQIKEAMPVMKEYENIWADIGQAQSVAMGNLVAGWVSVIKLFKNANSMLEQFLNTLLQVGLQQLAMAAIGSFGGGGLLGLIGGAFGGGKAIGGSVSSNKAYLVGERGPELFVPNSMGTIIPNNQMNTSLGKINSSIQAMNQNSLNKSASPIIINTELDSLRFTQKKIVTSEKRLERGQKFGS